MSITPYIPPDSRDSIIREQAEKISFLEDQVADLTAAVRESKRKNEAAVRGLRTVLSPLYRALQAVMGDIDGMIGQDAEQQTNPKAAGVWQSWIQKLGGKKAEVIKALLEHGEMNVPQLRVATHSAQQTIYEVTSALFRLGLLNKNGGRYSLKSL